MNNQKSLTRIATVVLALLLTAGCAGMNRPPTFAEQLQAEGARATELAQQWEHGDELASDGEALVRKAEKRARKAEKLQARGERLARDGESRVVAQKQAYAGLASSIGVAASPEQLLEDLKALRTVASEWADALEDVERGEAMLADSQETLAEASRDIREGTRMVERGRAQMRAAEDGYRAARAQAAALSDR